MTDPTIPTDRKDVHDALSALLPVVYEGDDAGLQMAADTLNDSAHNDTTKSFLAYGDHIIGSTRTFISLSAFVPETDTLHHRLIERMTPLVDALEQALDAAHLHLSKQAHPAGKKI